ncbi:MAG: TonB-dependent receptor, partial [Cytophagales bacterium]|nr:TonB-dependent receptor [Cytophagales bacterium]
MHKGMLAAWLLLFSLAARAQFTLSGAVTEAGTDQPLPGATVSPGGNLGATATGNDGRYQLSNLPAGRYSVTFSFVGFARQTRQVDLTGNLTLDVALPRATVLAEEVIVTATRAGENAPIAFTNVDKAELARRNFGQDLPFLLNETPSVVVTSDAGAGVGYTGIRIRGSDPTRINVTVNGIPLNDAESHGVFWVNMPDFASSVDNIQVQRGVGTSTNGAAAFGATLSLQTETLNREPFAEVNNSFGSFGTHKHTVKVGTGLLGGKWAFDGRLSRLASEGYIDRGRSDLGSYFVSGGYYGGKTVLKANVFSGREVTYQSWYGVPEARLKGDVPGMRAYIERNGLSEAEAQNLLTSGRTYNYYTYEDQTDNYRQDHYQFLFSHEPATGWNLNAALHYTRGKGYYEEFRAGEALTDYGLPDLALGDSTVRSTDLVRRRWLDNHFYGFTYSAAYAKTGKWDAVLGGGWNRYQGVHFGEITWARFAGNANVRQRYYENDAWKSDFNAYAKLNYEVFEKLNAFADVQFRHIGYSFLGYNQRLENVQQRVQYPFFNPKAGLTYRLGGPARLYASYAVSHREPTRDDFTQSSPESRPRPERLGNWEAGFRRQGKTTRLGANLYYMHYRDQLVLTGEINDVGAYVRTNIPRSYRAGLELDGSVQLLNKLHWAANATFSRNKIRDFRQFVDDYDLGEQRLDAYRETDISFSPRFIGSSTLTYSPVKDLSVALVSKYVSKQYLDNT